MGGEAMTTEEDDGIETECPTCGALALTTADGYEAVEADEPVEPDDDSPQVDALVCRLAAERASYRAALELLADAAPKDREELSDWDVADVYRHAVEVGRVARRALDWEPPR